MYKNCENDNSNPKDLLLRNKSPYDEAYASLSRDNISSIDDSNVENLQIQFRASSTPRQPSIFQSRLKSIGNQSNCTAQQDIFAKHKFDFVDDKKQATDETHSSGFNGDISTDLGTGFGKFTNSIVKPLCANQSPFKESEVQRPELQPLDLRINRPTPCAHTKDGSGAIGFHIQTLLNSNQNTPTLPLVPPKFEFPLNSENCSNHNFGSPSDVLRAMTEFFVLVQQQQQQQQQRQQHQRQFNQPSHLSNPKWSHQFNQLVSLPNNFSSCASDSTSQWAKSDSIECQSISSKNQAQLTSLTFGLNSQPKPWISNWDFTDSQDSQESLSDRKPPELSSHRPVSPTSMLHNRATVSSQYSDSITESRDLKSTNNSCENDLGNKGPTLFYFPEPMDSKDKVRTMLEQNDPRLKYVNDGAAIRNPFAVDRKTQLNHLTAMLCIKLDNNCYLCKGCNRTTTRLRPMQQHLLSHSASKFNLCVRCLKGFNDKYDMKRHTRKHTFRPYVCPECNRSFSQRCSLEGHRRKIHKVRLEYTPNQRREIVRVCEHCGYACAHLVDMVHHTTTYHPSSTNLTRLKRQLTRHEDRLKRDHKGAVGSSLKSVPNFLNINELVSEPHDLNLETIKTSCNLPPQPVE